MHQSGPQTLSPAPDDVWSKPSIETNVNLGSYGAQYFGVIRRDIVIPGIAPAQFAIARWGRRFAISRRHREMSGLSRLTRSRSDAQRFTNRGIDNRVSAG